MALDTTLVSTVAVGLGYAFVGGAAAARLGLPPLVGYLAAGIAVGPFTPGFVADATLAPQLAEIGVILLMFGVGLHFSVADLLAVWPVAVPGAVIQIAAATAMGYGLARWWGWPTGAGLVFGLALSVASTVVLLKALEGQGRLDSPDGRLAVGWLIVEDLAMVLALVLLPALAGPLGGNPAVGGGPLWQTVAVTLLKVVAFVAVVLVAGGRVFPWVLGKVAADGSRELFTLAVVTLSLGVAYGSAALFGVSFALGAFFAGVVVSGSGHRHRAEQELQPLQTVFAALFFVSVGMLFDPGILLRQPGRVLAEVAVVVVGKSIAAALLVLTLRRSVGTALTVSAALAQVGEFSFILAAMGASLGLLPPDGPTLVVAAALFSIVLNPAAFAVARRLSRRYEPDGYNVASK